MDPWTIASPVSPEPRCSGVSREAEGTGQPHCSAPASWGLPSALTLAALHGTTGLGPRSSPATGDSSQPWGASLSTVSIWVQHRGWDSDWLFCPSDSREAVVWL